ncbi:hypothetical protein QE152_g8386 [Popillia japonica]|uniref:Uncharacterized protein n=1 Tax=Popillia japonica TaxID=7064 RepID=A0AAW1MCF0_POPJA
MGRTPFPPIIIIAVNNSAHVIRHVVRLVSGDSDMSRLKVGIPCANAVTNTRTHKSWYSLRECRNEHADTKDHEDGFYAFLTLARVPLDGVPGQITAFAVVGE